MYQRTAVVLLLATALSAPVLAQPGTGAGAGQGQGPRRMMLQERERLHEKLNLTKDQEEKMKKMRADFQKKMVQNQSKIRLTRIDLRELMDAEKMDRTAIEKTMKEVSDLQLQAKLDGLDHFMAVQGILTPEQKEIWKQHRPMRRMGLDPAPGERRMRYFRWRGDGPAPEIGMDTEIEEELVEIPEDEF